MESDPLEGIQIWYDAEVLYHLEYFPFAESFYAKVLIYCSLMVPFGPYFTGKPGF